jgi:hypothetical protein
VSSYPLSSEVWLPVLDGDLYAHRGRELLAGLPPPFAEVDGRARLDAGHRRGRERGPVDEVALLRVGHDLAGAGDGVEVEHRARDHIAAARREARLPLRFEGAHAVVLLGGADLTRDALELGAHPLPDPAVVAAGVGVDGLGGDEVELGRRDPLAALPHDVAAEDLLRREEELPPARHDGHLDVQERPVDADQVIVAVVHATLTRVRDLLPAATRVPLHGQRERVEALDARALTVPDREECEARGHARLADEHGQAGRLALDHDLGVVERRLLGRRQEVGALNGDGEAVHADGVLDHGSLLGENEQVVKDI